MRKPTFVPSTIVVVIFALGTPAIAQAAPPLPGNSNALMIVDVAKLVNSPMGKQLSWQAKLARGYADRPLPVPPTAKRISVVALVHPAGMQALWQASIVELTNPLNFDPMLRAQGGYLDQIGGKHAAWSPRDAFYIEFEPTTLGVVRPGQRQFVTRWTTGKNLPELSQYLKLASTASGDVIFAMDLDDVIGTTAVMYADAMGNLPSLDKVPGSNPKFLAALASIKGIQLVMNVTDHIDAVFVADFDQDVSAIGDQAKPLILDAMKIADSYEPAIEKMDFKVEGKRVTGRGTIEPESIARLLAMLAPGHSEDAAPAPAPAPAADPKLEAAAASQRYYKAVAGILDNLSGKTSPSQSASYLVGKARVIEQLPVLNVDPDLLAWGNMVTETLNRAAQELAVGQQKAIVASQNVQSPTGYTTYDGSDTPETRSAYKNAQQERRRLAQEERGAAVERALAIINEVLPTRGKIRAAMSQKYGVEF